MPKLNKDLKELIEQINSVRNTFNVVLIASFACFIVIAFSYLFGSCFDYSYCPWYEPGNQLNPTTYLPTAATEKNTLVSDSFEYYVKQDNVLRHYKVDSNETTVVSGNRTDIYTTVTKAEQEF